MAPEIVAAGVTAAGALGSSLVGSAGSRALNAQNIDYQNVFNKQALLHELVSQQIAKEAYTRAGYSPLVAVGQGDNGGFVASAPQNTVTGAGDSSMSDMIGSVGNFTSELLKNRLSNKQIDINDKHFNVEAYLRKMDIDERSKNALLSMENALKIANDKNSTDVQIQEAKNKTMKYIEQLKEQNDQLMQDEAIKAQTELLEKQLKNDRGNTWIKSGTATFNTLLNIASKFIPGGNYGSSAPIGFMAY